ncbi:MAG: hypothetical protein FWH12_01400 [Treponema sp.]|nr:hypothetical protein [Treponema sp.]
MKKGMNIRAELRPLGMIWGSLFLIILIVFASCQNPLVKPFYDRLKGQLEDEQDEGPYAPVMVDITGGEQNIPFDDLQAALEFITEARTYRIRVAVDQTLDPVQLSINGSRITLVGRYANRTVGVQLEGNGSLFTIGSNVRLTLGDGISLRGHEDNNASLVRVEGNARFEMQGGDIRGNTAPYGGGVYVDANGGFAKTGGTIYGADGGLAANMATGTAPAGNAVFHNSSPSKVRTHTALPSRNMDSSIAGPSGGWDVPGGGDSTGFNSLIATTNSGGTITLNQSYDLGAGNISINKDLTFTTQPGAHVTITRPEGNNPAFDVMNAFILRPGAGGSITIQGDPNVPAVQPLIHVRTSGHLIIHPGVNIINTQTTEDINAGVYLNGSGARFTMEGGEISGHLRPSANGGGVYVQGGTFTMRGGIIRNNTALGGGAVAVYGEGSFVMSGGTITGNRAHVQGGGVLVLSGSFTKTGNSIITGYPSDSVIGNVVRNSAGVLVDDMGHGVYSTVGPRRRENTAGPGVNLDSGEPQNWEY